MDDVRLALAAVAREFPDRRTGRIDLVAPRYAAELEDTFLITRVLLVLGFSPTDLTAMDREHPVGDLFTMGAAVADSRQPVLRCIDPLALLLLAYIQQSEDTGLTWRRIAGAAFIDKPWYRTVSRDRAARPWLYPA